ncbi:DUF1127 domain-containing protein [Xanthobacter variabilis]|uniref:DUF1127 domain-containing protein n=1 Tax=Xanthobacter variabilis TaxID=3119932 RepID=UPI00372BC778
MSMARMPFPQATTMRDAASRNAGMLGSALIRFVNVLNGWKAFHQIADLDDARLADLGLTRSDVERARLTPVYRNPTAELAHAARERHLDRPAE